LNQQDIHENVQIISWNSVCLLLMIKSNRFYLCCEIIMLYNYMTVAKGKMDMTAMKYMSELAVQQNMTGCTGCATKHDCNEIHV